MTRTAVPLRVDDLSPFAKTLRQALTQHEGVPSHVELLNLIAKAAGFSNYQHLRADAGTAGRLEAAVAPTPPADLRQVEKAARYFDDRGVLMSWPARFNLQTLCQWVFWSRIPPDMAFSEREISDLIRDWHDFGDHALIRRAMVDARMLERTVDGREYRRIEQAPPPELKSLLAHLAARVTK
ncbi:DUF2087 domain-containing protein [Devosia sp. A16]|uniref:DUF2087 domain-containing protein n=1 Tax=Devosia sp. A16 TaxID=1736675 RepID=UPI0006D76F68|nr:DUF2087 domain-containing protein [Devosia sp. A16]